LWNLGYNKLSDPGGALWKVAKRKRIFALHADRRYVLNVKYVPVHLNGAMDVNVSSHRNSFPAAKKAALIF
jgi:hypothetical protein